MDSHSMRFRFVSLEYCDFDSCCSLERKMYDQHTNLKLTPVQTAQIINLPPFLHRSRNVNVPAVDTPDTITTVGNCDGDGEDDDGSCCTRREHKNYERYTTRTGTNNIVRSSRNGRERRKNFHALLSAMPAQQSELNRPNGMDSAATSAKCVKSPATSISTPSQSSLSSPVPAFYSTSSLALALSLPLPWSPPSSSLSFASSSSSASQQQQQQQQQQISQNGQRCCTDGDRTLKTNSHVVDSTPRNKLSNTQTQLVMPIGESRLGTVWSVQSEETWTPTATHSFHTTYAKYTKNSQTTTLECRCFKKIGDINSGGVERDLQLEVLNVAETETEAQVAKHKQGHYTAAAPICCRTTHEEAHEHELSRQELQFQQLRQQMPQHWSQVLKMLAASKWLSVLLLLTLLTSSVNCWAGRQDVPSNCTFPARWEGSWFLSGYQQSIHIKGSQFSYRGKCAASDGNKYLIVDERGCHRCLVIYEKHKNVLQYKESECEGDSMYMHQSNPSAMAMRSVLKQTDLRGGAHPNTNGHSRLSSSDQYIMRSNDDMNDCPPDFCKGRETLQNLCDQIPGDALLYSLFRESAEPVKCPLKGPFVFTYNRGHGECKSPVSNIESCTEESRLLLSFQACPDVQGTESTVEELTCLATWKDGNSRYLVGLVSHHHAISNEERYRCFVYEKISSLMGAPSIVTSKDAEYKLAQSGDATCNGLDSAEVGSRIMSLRKPPLAERCDFPVWFKGPRHWHALMGNAVYNYHSNDGSVHIIKPNGYMETRALCEQINKQTPTEMTAVVHYTTGCQSGFMCMVFYRRDTHVIEIQTGKQAARLESACDADHFDGYKMPYITLLASNPDPQICPMEGLYNLRGAIGPPYLTTRHKRNHNNKVHGPHGGHHHQIQSETAVTGAGGSSSGNGHKKHGTLSFRNSEKIEKDFWHSNTRGLPVRSRRATKVNSQLNTNREAQVADSMLLEQNIASKDFLSNSSGDNLTTTEEEAIRQRSRRDAPTCITNYKAQRQLWVGCTEPNVIDVRPLCNDEGDEEYSCHGSWSENGTVFIIARHKGSKHGVCISYKPTEGTSAKLVIGDACHRSTQKIMEHHLVANLSVYGKCGETHSSATQISVSSLLAILAVAILTTLLGAHLKLWSGSSLTSRR